jgi:hypothetical protein
MEYDNHYASNGKGNLGVTLGAIGTGLGVLSGGLNGILGNGCGGATWNNGGGCCSENNFVNRYEASQSARIAELETEVKLRDANTFTMGEMGKLRDYVDSRFSSVESQICQQSVYNATNTATLNCLANQIAVLQGLTKTIIPADNICPTPMPQYNSWTAPTAGA